MIPHRSSQPYVPISARRDGDVAKSLANATKGRALLGWTAKFDVDEMCASTWRWQSMNPDGYQD